MKGSNIGRRPLFLIAVVCLVLFPRIQAPAMANAVARALADQAFDVLVKEVPKVGPLRVGVLDFVTNSAAKEETASQAGQSLADQLIGDLLGLVARTGLESSITLVERSQLHQILKEEELHLSGLTDNKVVEVGTQLALDIIIVGRISDNHAVARLIRVRTGEILGVTSATLRRPQTLVDQVIHIEPGRFRDFELSVEEATTLWVECRSFLSFNLFLLDAENFRRYSHGESFVAVRSDPQFTRGNVAVQVEKGRIYHLVLENHAGHLMPRRVKVKVRTAGPLAEEER